MRRCFILVLSLVVLSGCHERDRATVVRTQADGPARANLALGPSVETSRLAALYTDRSDWPSTVTGYRVDDVTYYTSSNYDVQLHFDRNSSLYQEALNVRTGIWVR